MTVIYPSHRDREQGTRPTISKGDRDRAARAAYKDWKSNRWPDGRPSSRPGAFLSILMTSDGLSAEYLAWGPGRAADREATDA